MHLVSVTGIVALTIFTGGLFLMGMVSPNFREFVTSHFKELLAGSEIHQHYVLQKIEQEKLQPIFSALEDLQFSIENNDNVPEELSKISFCIAIQYNHGEVNANKLPFDERCKVKKQFLFESKDNSTFSKQQIFDKIDKVKQDLEQSIIDEIDPATNFLNFSCTTLHQGSHNEKIIASHYAPHIFLWIQEKCKDYLILFT